ncbi:MAG: phospho-sugar mutase [Verrucomicrobiota bacterium]
MAMLDDVRAAAKAEKILSTTAKNVEAWLQADAMPEWATESIGELIEAEAWEELDNRFYKHMAFGTGGIRGATIAARPTKAELGGAKQGQTPAHPAVGTALVNDFKVIQATIGLYVYARKYLADKQTRFEVPKLVIAHDVRHFSRHFTELAASTWTRLGGLAMIFDGPRSTPHLSFAVRYLRATCGVVITASHNPPSDNGFKAYFDDGAQVVDPHATGIINLVEQVGLDEACAFLDKDMDGVIELPVAVDEAYMAALEENVLDADVLRERKPKVVFTPIHGTGSIMSVPLMERFGVEVVKVPEQERLDANFPSVKSPNPENSEALKLAIAKADEVGADVVMATDPDCDRMGVAVRDHEGKMMILTGNMTGSLLAEYRIRTLKDGGVLPEKGTEDAVLIKTFVTTPLQEAIAEKHGLKLINTLTGFKWIGEKLNIYERELKSLLLEEEGMALDYDQCMQDTRAELMLDYSTFFVFGGEESYGYLGSDRVRDKDANAAAIMFCEMLAWLESEDMTVLDFLDSLYLEHGYYLEDLANIYYEGASGSAKIKRIIDSYRENPPKELGGMRVSGFTDFGEQDLHDADGKPIPKENFYFLDLGGNYKYAVRGSGTEPKIKFYLFGREDVPSADLLPEVKKTTEKRLQALREAIEKDAHKRAES